MAENKQLSWLLDDVPPSRYALPNDGRQRRHKCERRKIALQHYVNRASDDGTEVFPSVKTIARKMEVSERTADSLTADLLTLGALVNVGWHPTLKTRKRSISLEWIARNSAPAPAQSSTDLLVSPAQSSTAPAQSSRQSIFRTPQDCAQPYPSTTQPSKPNPPTLPARDARKPEGWRGVLFSNQDVIGAPGKAELAEIEMLMAAEPTCGAEYLKRASLLFYDRPKGARGLNSPWRVFLAEGWFAVAKNKCCESHDWKMEHDPEYRAAQEASIERQIADTAAFMRDRPVQNEMTVEDFLKEE